MRHHKPGEGKQYVGGKTGSHALPGILPHALHEIEEFRVTPPQFQLCADMRKPAIDQLKVDVAL